MHIRTVERKAAQFEPGETCLMTPVFEGEKGAGSKLLDAAAQNAIQDLIARRIVLGKPQETYYLPAPAGRCRGVLIVGLGKRAAVDAEVLRRAAGKACAVFKQNRVSHVYIDGAVSAELPIEAFIEGIILGSYAFDVYKKPAEPGERAQQVESITVIVEKKRNVAEVRQRCEYAAVVTLSANGARHLANTPANDMTPTALAKYAEGIAAQSDCRCDILEETQMASLGMNALLGVARGSSEAPKLITLRYRFSDKAPTLALVGKGVTFDTGGVSLKPPENMHEMKYDMCGAAAVLGTMLAVTQLRPRVNVVCVVPAVENKIGPAAQVPGDIVTAYNGTTIEVHNTDAEGRLILADALAYTADTFKPAAMVDVATLTGACIVALGHFMAGVVTNDDRLFSTIEAAGRMTGERVWRLPLDDDYRELVKGAHADLCNIGPPKEAGTIVGGAFLEKFTGGTPWAHLDIAGTAWDVKKIPYWDAKHATGFGVRLLTRWIADFTARTREK